MGIFAGCRFSKPSASLRMEARLRAARFFGVWQGSSPVMTSASNASCSQGSNGRGQPQNGRGHWPRRCDGESRFNGCRSGFFIRARRSYGGDAAKRCPVGVPFLEPCNVIRGAANALFNAIATFGKFRVGQRTASRRRGGSFGFYLEPKDNRLFLPRKA